MSTETIKTTEIFAAQLYWDDQDQAAAGWWLRYYDSTGTEQGIALEGDEDATTEELAAAAQAALPDRDGEIEVYRHEELRGRITLRGDESPDWRAL